MVVIIVVMTIRTEVFIVAIIMDHHHHHHDPVSHYRSHVDGLDLDDSVSSSWADDSSPFVGGAL